MSLKEKFSAYLKAYSELNLDKVSDMFAEDITLRDWKISVSGKEAAIFETNNNFLSSDSVDIEILNMYESNNAVAGELKITVDKSEIIYVVDVITFNTQGKISSIRAYIGRAD